MIMLKRLTNFTMPRLDYRLYVFRKVIVDIALMVIGAAKDFYEIYDHVQEVDNFTIPRLDYMLYIFKNVIVDTKIVNFYACFFAPCACDQHDRHQCGLEKVRKKEFRLFKI